MPSLTNADCTWKLAARPVGRSRRDVRRIGSCIRKLGASLILVLGCLLPIGLPGQDVDVSRKVENLGLPNWAGQDYAPAISPDGRYLIFQSDRPGKYENQNLWFSINSNSAQPTEQADWSVPVPLFLPMEGEPSRTMQILEDGEP
ncbi:MAG: PD40 domain-containing protein, partial [Leptospiraceae bacterium]|nr:PD40 domain-containing protein [Leptospiraceae bacterium]